MKIPFSSSSAAKLEISKFNVLNSQCSILLLTTHVNVAFCPDGAYVLSLSPAGFSMKILEHG